MYLYLINYAKSQPEKTLLAVNTFVKDANDPNPLIRALAVRTMGCIRVDRITEVRLDKERSDDLTTQSQAAKTTHTRTSVQDTPPP